MGSLSDDDETQPYDSQYSTLSGDNSKGKDFDHHLQNRMPLLETVPFEDGLETQVMNFEGETQVACEDGLETQVMNFEGETQVQLEDELVTQAMNFGGETQVLDDFVGNMDTQLLYEWNSEEADRTDGEESDKTEMLCDTDELSDNDSVKIVGCSSEVWDKTIISKQDDKENKADLDALFYKQTSAGVKINFTSVRAAALRASGLAARSNALFKSNSEICSSKTENGSRKEDHAHEDYNATGIRESLVREGEIDDVLEDEQRKGIRDESKGRNGNSAARRLFLDGDKLDENKYDKLDEDEDDQLDENEDDKLDENEVPNDKYLNHTDEVDLLQCNDIVGLSYVDSQEPGDLSQANALDFVDKFLISNDTDFDKGVGTVGPVVKKLKPDSSIKGTQSLAKKSRLKSISSETGIYDWDDNREDEGGGEFFSRQKKVFFDDEGKSVSHSRSASKLHSSKRIAKKAKVAAISKNLMKELDEQLNLDSSDGMKATCSEKDLQDMVNVGPDTQMAAEAMEVLGLGLDVTNKDTNGITKNTRKSFSNARKNDKSLPKKYSLRKRSSSSSDEDLRTKSKQRKKSGKKLINESSVLSSKQNKSVMDQNKDHDKSNAISPLTGCEQVRTFTPIASRTRQHSGTRQPIAGNITCDIGTLSYKKGRRSRRKMSDNVHGPVNQLSGPETKEQPREELNGSKINPQSFSVNHSITRKTCSSLRTGIVDPSLDRERVESLCDRSGEKEELAKGNFKCKLRDVTRVQTEFSERNLNLHVSPGERSKLSVSTSTTPASCTSSVAAASPICMGDEYLKQSCRKNLVREIDSLVSQGSDSTSPMKESRRRRDMANVRVLFSHHLDDDVIKHQKKILAKLGSSVAPSIREATHFVTDQFVRTRNMLEAIAFGKPVVTHLWLESCGQASCCIDEKNYILRDVKKEKEFGFSLPASLAQACHCPLLQGLKVWITPSTKPGVEILSSLVKAVHGVPLERIGRSVLNDERIPDDLLALSCEEDYSTCLPFLEKGGAIFSSELLLNGIVTQKLEFERHQLFDNRVKKTRSTRWPKRDSNQCLSAAKGK